MATPHYFARQLNAPPANPGPFGTPRPIWGDFILATKVDGGAAIDWTQLVCHVFVNGDWLTATVDATEVVPDEILLSSRGEAVQVLVGSAVRHGHLNDGPAHFVIQANATYPLRPGRNALPIAAIDTSMNVTLVARFRLEPNPEHEDFATLENPKPVAS